MEATDELGAAGWASTAGDGPAVLGRYRLGERLGSGGFGSVYAAHDERLDRAVAVKVVRSGAPAPERAPREALAAARLDHPGIVAVYDAGEAGDERYLVSELVRGRTLDVLAKEGALSDRDVLRIGLALADALAHAHERGVIHRDVKPQNVIVPDRPRSARSAAKLTDFGIAHLAGDEPLTQTGDVVGTLAYMAPEQAAGRRVDERADLYSLALVLYEALTGVNPVRAASPAATAKRVGTVLPGLGRKRRDLPGGLCAAVDRSLRPRPEDRGTLEELGDAIAGALPEVDDEGGTILAHPLERAGTATVPPLAGRAAAALAAGALAAAASTLLAHPPPPPATGAVVALAVGILLRAGWVATAAVAVVALAAADRPGPALVLLAALGPAAAAIRGTGRAWSLPAAAPLLHVAALASAFPALAGRAHSAAQRAALGAAGAWWWLLVLGHAPARWPHAAGPAFRRVIEPPFASGLALVLVLWAAAALVLPWLVRGRRLGLDVVLASAWAAGLGSGTQALAEWAGAALPHGVTAGAIVAGALALVLPRTLPLGRLDAESG